MQKERGVHVGASGALSDTVISSKNCSSSNRHIVIAVGL